MVKQTKGVAGDIFECGVYYGNSLMNYANLSVALEPYNYQCKIVGFDTFEGGVGISSKDLNNPYFERKDGEYYADSYEDLQQSIEIFDLDRPLNHLEKVRLIKGDIRVEGEKYLINNPQTVIRILSLTMNFYEPTKFALENFYPRLAVGGILVINGLNHAAGATVALNEFLGIGSSRIKVFDFYPNITYMIKE